MVGWLACRWCVLEGMRLRSRTGDGVSVCAWVLPCLGEEGRKAQGETWKLAAG